VYVDPFLRLRGCGSLDKSKHVQNSAQQLQHG
jgi:hypothetical protein